MGKKYKRQTRIVSSRILLTLALLLGGLCSGLAYNQTYKLNVGDQFTVYTSYHYYTISVIWNYDPDVVEPVDKIYDASTSVTFKCIAASPKAGSIIQAITYYYKENTTSSGINKDLDDWLIHVKDNSTVSLDKNSFSLDLGSSEYLTAKPSNSSYSGKYTWSSSKSNVASISGSGNRVRIVAKNSGSTIITVKLDNGNSAQCEVTVRTVNVSSAEVSPSMKLLNIDETASLSLSVLPSNATVTSRSWKSNNSNIASVNSSGTVTGVSEGNTEIYCVVNGSVTSTTCLVVISKPSFTLSSSSPLDNATDISVFAQPLLTFCRAIYKGTAFSNISLKDKGGRNIDGTVSINENTLTFVPSAPLQANTGYTLAVPASAVKDKYGSTNSSVTCTFTTGNLQKLIIKASTTERFLTKGEKITLTTNGVNVPIYYTLDGSMPTDKSSRYQSAIDLNSDIKLRAIAMGAGYENSDIFSQDYYLTNVDVVKKFPNANTNLYEYKDVNPYITFSNDIVGSSNIGGIKVYKNGTEEVSGEVIVADSTIFFVPKQPLDLGCNYQVFIPGNAVKTSQGEENDETSWSFSTGNYATSIAMGGPELAMVRKTDGNILIWGSLYKSGNVADGSYVGTQQLTPDIFMSENILSMSSGYMHHAIIKNDGSLWMWGRQYCGEFGNKSTTGSATPIKVMDDVAMVSCGGQTTAIVTIDGSLWMCGRNDFGLIGDNTVVHRDTPVRIMGDVRSAVAGWCVTYAIKQDGSLWAWGRNDKSQLGNGTSKDSWIPVMIMENVTHVATSATETKWAAVIKTDNSLWIWGETQPIPIKILDNVSSVAVGANYVEAVMDNGTLWAFGNNDYGQLGCETTSSSSSPIKIMENVSNVASGGHTTMAKMLDGSVWTWGRNNTGTLGDGSIPSLTAFSSKPIQVVEGRSSSLLTGITSRKKTYRIVKGDINVIDALPMPLNAVYNDLSWESKNSSIVSVSDRGVIKGVSLGETDVVITAKNDKDTECSMACRVIVTDATRIDDMSNFDVNFKVRTNYHQIHIAGLQIGQHITIFAASGVLIYQGVADNTEMTIPIKSSGVYGVKVDSYRTKVLVQ